jgi:cyclopropane fatty-acyl-phospholipid synthase-like methyltransferase
MIAGVGSLIGCGAGSLLTLLVSHIPIRVRGLIYANHF